MTRIALPFLIVALLAGPAAEDVYAQFSDTARDVTKRGTTAADFLGIPVGARATGMGNAITATIDDPTAIYWNPAGLTGVTANSATFEYAEWLANIEFNFVSIVVPSSIGTIGLGFTQMRTPDMEVTTESQQDGTGETFNASSYALAFSYARALTDRFSIGGSIKLIDERIWNSTAGGVAFDVGTTFITPFYGIKLGAAISNFGSKMQLGGDDLLIVADIDPNNGGNNESNRALLKTDAFDLPLTMRIGLAADVVQQGSSRLTLAVEALNPNNSEQYVNVGAEVGLLNDLLMVRGGYGEIFLDNNVRTFSLGAGLRYRFAPLNLAVDYAFEAQEFFDDVNRFTVTVGF